MAVQLVRKLTESQGNGEVLPKGVGLNVNFPDATMNDCSESARDWILTRLLGNIDKDPVSF